MDKEKMLAMRLDGCTYRQIGEEAGLSEQYIQQLLSPPKPIREYIIKKYNGRCANCGILITGKSAHVHHKDHTDNHYNDIDNLELLCPSCHRGKHPETPYYKNKNFKPNLNR